MLVRTLVLREFQRVKAHVGVVRDSLVNMPKMQLKPLHKYQYDACENVRERIESPISLVVAMSLVVTHLAYTI